MNLGGAKNWPIVRINKLYNEYCSAEALLNLPRYVKRLVVGFVDVALTGFSIWLAFYLRLGVFKPIDKILFQAFLVAIVFVIPIFCVFGLYQNMFRYTGFATVISIARALSFYGVCYAGVFTFWSVRGVPRTVGLIQPLLLFILVGFSRAVVPFWLKDIVQGRRRNLTSRKMMIYGASDAGIQLAQAISKSLEARVVGFLDDDRRLHGNILNGVKIYNPEEIKKIVADTAVTDVLLALPHIPRWRRNQIINILKKQKVAVRTVPDICELATGYLSFSDIRELDVDDLLGREVVEANEQLLLRETRGKIVLVTGAGGSIGSELCRQILMATPKVLLLFELSEFALYDVHRSLQKELRAGVQKRFASAQENSSHRAGPHGDENIVEDIILVPLLGSVCDEDRMRNIFQTWRPETVYHAAAYKHVPIVEHNPIEGFRNNVNGTRVCAEAAVKFGVNRFVLVSTDKAVRPTNIMGATKRLAEMVLQGLANDNLKNGFDHPTVALKRTVFSMVRFGNVLGSSGSVVPNFREQVKTGGPVTVTHSEMTRYFMSIPEAAQLVIQAGAMGTGGDVFVLDMGEPVKILDLARRVVELSGLEVRDASNPNGDIEIQITGLRPGEKLYEELLIGDNSSQTQHPLIRKAHEPYLKWPELLEELQLLNKIASQGDVAMLIERLKKLVVGYSPTGEVMDWVYQEKRRTCFSKKESENFGSH